MLARPKYLLRSTANIKAETKIIEKCPLFRSCYLDHSGHLTSKMTFDYEIQHTII